MTYGEVKEKIRDYGFEEDSTMQEYQTIVKNAVNTATQFIYDDIVMYLSGYYKRSSSYDSLYASKRPEYITDETQNDFEIKLPANVLELVPLLASYFVWLDDDNVKATLYWNVYDEKKQGIISACMRNASAKICGGLGW